MPQKTHKTSTAHSSPLLTMEEAIAELSTTRPTFYRWLRAGSIKGVKVGRQWRFRPEDIARFMQGEGARIEAPADLKPLIQKLREHLGEREKATEATGDQVALAGHLALQLALQRKASHLHLVSFATHSALQLRIDGTLIEIARLEAHLLQLLVAWLKHAAGMDEALTTQTQDGVIKLRAQQVMKINVTTLPTAHGECLAAHLIEQSADLPELTALDLGERELRLIQQAATGRGGLVIFASTTGRARNPTMYASAKYVSGTGIRLVSVGRYAAYHLADAIRVRVDEPAGQGYPYALRSAQRIDPDVILLDELHERETMETAIECTMHGQLVMASIHAPDAIAALLQVAELCAKQAAGLEEVRMIVAQRLVRRLCPHCAIAIKPPLPLLRRAELVAGTGGVPWNSLTPLWKHAGGCDDCRGTGFAGFGMLSEVLEVTPELRHAVRTQAGIAELRSIALEQGFATIAADGVRKAAKGVTSLQELQRTLPELAGARH